MSEGVALKRCRDCGTADQDRLVRNARTGKLQTICKPCKYKRELEWRETPTGRERWQYHQRRARLLEFGITPEQYDEMLAAQGGVCAICGGLCPTGRSLAVDHDHETGAIRALLCLTCNRSLGIFENFGAQAQAYLDQYGSGNPALVNRPLAEEPPRQWRVGSASSMAKLTEEQVEAIRARYAAGGISQRALAREFGISQINISRIVRRERWQHVA